MLACFLSTLAAAQNYTAARASDHGVFVVRLTDIANGVQVSIAPSIGNRAYQMTVQGKDILYSPALDIGELAKAPGLSGVPLLAPWADLLNEPAFWANGKRYAFNLSLGNVRGPMPGHGLLSASPLWHASDVAADLRSAHVTSRLEFWKYPDLMAQWPFAHNYEITYRLAGGILEVETTITNLSVEPMPVVIGFHPYFQIPGVPRDQWVVRSPARIHVIADKNNIPTGEMRAQDLPNPLPLRGRALDDGFTDLERDAEGRAHFSIQADGRTVETIFGPKYTVATIWLPTPPLGETREFICIEPLTTIISGVNLAHEGKYPALQTLPPGGQWRESFWIRATGF